MSLKTLMMSMGAGSTLLNGIVAGWKLDGNGNDSVSTRNLTGGATFPAGKIGNCANSNGGQVLSVGSSPVTGSNVDFSFFCWIRTTATGNYWGIIGFGAESGNAAMFISLNPSNKLALSLYGSAELASSAADINDGQWHLVGMVANNRRFQCYVDGVASGSGTGTQTYNLGNSYTTLFRVYSGGGILNGDLDEVYMWNRALTSGEITELYNSGNGKTHPF